MSNMSKWTVVVIAWAAVVWLAWEIWRAPRQRRNPWNVPVIPSHDVALAWARHKRQQLEEDPAQNRYVVCVPCRSTVATFRAGAPPTVPVVCPHCGLGCSEVLGEEAGA